VWHEDFLARLVKLSGLKTFHYCNRIVRIGSLEAEESPMAIDWSLLRDCTSLRQVSFARIGEEVREWLNSNGKSVEELIITNRYNYNDIELKNHNSLNLPALSTLLTDEDSEGGTGIYEDSSEAEESSEEEAASSEEEDFSPNERISDTGVNPEERVKTTISPETIFLKS